MLLIRKCMNKIVDTGPYKLWSRARTVTNKWLGRQKPNRPYHPDVASFWPHHCWWEISNNKWSVHRPLSLIDLHKRPFVFRDSSLLYSVQLIHFLSDIFLRATLNSSLDSWFRFWFFVVVQNLLLIWYCL